MNVYIEYNVQFFQILNIYIYVKYVLLWLRFLLLLLVVVVVVLLSENDAISLSRWLYFLIWMCTTPLILSYG